MRNPLSIDDVLALPHSYWQSRYGAHSRLARFLNKIDYRDPSGCWLWTGATTDMGYGTKSIDGRDRLVHRLMFELYYGPIPSGLALDHICKTTRCLNPEHLEPVTQRENMYRGSHWAIEVMHTNTCRRGHLYTPENTYIRPGGSRRSCRECISIHLATRSRDPALPIKENCVRGHPLEGSNVGVSSRGYPYCRTCRNEAKRLRRAAKGRLA